MKKLIQKTKKFFKRDNELQEFLKNADPIEKMACLIVMSKRLK